MASLPPVDSLTAAIDSFGDGLDSPSQEKNPPLKSCLTDRHIEDVATAIHRVARNPTIKDSPSYQPPTILDEAAKLVYGARNQSYGHPRENFSNIASFWNAWMDARKETIFTPTDVAVMNILQKVARLANTPDHRDSLVDIAGYSATIERLISGE